MDALYTRFLAPAIPAALFAVGGYFLILSAPAPRAP